MSSAHPKRQPPDRRLWGVVSVVCLAVVAVAGSLAAWNAYAVLAQPPRALLAHVPPTRRLAETTPWQPHSDFLKTDDCGSACESGRPRSDFRHRSRLVSDIRAGLVQVGMVAFNSNAFGGVSLQQRLSESGAAPTHAETHTQATAADSAGAQLGGGLPRCPVPEIPLHPGYTCEAPYSADVRLHVIITMLDRSGYSDLGHLGMIGLTGAEVFIYLRTEPNDTRPAQVKLPCGMRFHERLLLPNLGEEGAVFATHVASVYDDMPDAIIALHGGKLTAWHARCSVAIRRMRAFYRGLGNGPQATPAMKAFASRAVTLNSLVTKGRVWSVNDCCGALMSKVKVKPEVDYPECPWERVGESPVLFEDLYPQPLCQLRNRTPDTNWTVLAIDVPEFFIRQSEILAQYESDPLRRVPITHQSPPTLESTAFSPSVTAASQAAIPLQAGSPVSTASSFAGRRLHAYDDAPELLENIRDFVLPQHRQSDLKGLRADGKLPPNDNDAVYGLERIWIWLLKAHGMYDLFMRPPGPGERMAAWCCFQFAVPKSVLLIAPKAWWVDVVHFATHLGWKDYTYWPGQIGLIFEYRLWGSLGQRYLTSESMAAYVNIDREMGEDPLLGRCQVDLDSSLCL